MKEDFHVVNAADFLSRNSVDRHISAPIFNGCERCNARVVHTSLAQFQKSGLAPIIRVVARHPVAEATVGISNVERGVRLRLGLCVSCLACEDHTRDFRSHTADGTTFVVHLRPRLLDEAEDEWIAVWLATGGLDRAQNRKHDGSDGEHDEHREADHDEAQNSGDDRPDDQADLEVERLFRVVLDELRIADAHDQKRHNEAEQHAVGDQCEQVAERTESVFLAALRFEICVCHYDPLSWLRIKCATTWSDRIA